MSIFMQKYNPFFTQLNQFTIALKALYCKTLAEKPLAWSFFFLISRKTLYTRNVTEKKFSLRMFLCRFEPCLY